MWILAVENTTVDMLYFLVPHDSWIQKKKKKAHNSVDHTDLIRCLPKKKKKKLNKIWSVQKGHSLTCTQIYYFKASHKVNWSDSKVTETQL
jgi:hypothetical protein